MHIGRFLYFRLIPIVLYIGVFYSDNKIMDIEDVLNYNQNRVRQNASMIQGDLNTNNDKNQQQAGDKKNISLGDSIKVSDKDLHDAKKIYKPVKKNIEYKLNLHQFDKPKRIAKTRLLNKDIHTINTPTKVITRLKDIVSVEGIRDNQLIGYGIVVGLNGTGDKTQSSPFTKESLIAMLERLGVNVRDLQGKITITNVAAVMVTANLPAFARRGNRIDVNVATMGTATSLMGGTLLPTILKGADGEVYAIAQGEVTSSGFVVQGANVKTTKGVPTNGKIVRGAIVENELDYELNDLDKITLSLHNPDFTTAMRISDVINKHIEDVHGAKNVAFAKDQSTVEVKIVGKDIVSFITEIEQLHITPDNIAKVIFDDRDGVVVITENVKISPVVVSYGALTVTVTDYHDYNNYSDDELKARLASQQDLMKKGHAGYHMPLGTVVQNDYYNSPYNNPYYTRFNNPWVYNPMFNQGQITNDYYSENDKSNKKTENSKNISNNVYFNNAFQDPNLQSAAIIADAKQRMQAMKMDSSVGVSESGSVNESVSDYESNFSDDPKFLEMKEKQKKYDAEHEKYNMFNGATLQDLMNTLNAIGTNPRDMISILQVLKRAGAIQATLEAM